MAALVLLAGFMTAQSAAQNQSGTEALPKHHTKSGFQNNYPYEHRLAGSYFKAAGDYMRASRVPVRFPLAPNDPAFLKQNRTRPTLTWIGHDTFLLQLGGLNILTDPHLTARASPFSFAGPERVVAPGLDFDQLPHIDVVLISHNHYDHLDEETVLRLSKQPGGSPQYFVPLGVKAWFVKRGIDKVVELDWWQQDSHAALKLHAVPVQHFSGRGLGDRNSTLWCAWVGEWGKFRFFFGGDSGYSQDFRDIGARFDHMDLSLIPIGAYEPRWFMQSMHVNPEEAVRIHQDVHSRYSVGMHWGTFRLTTEPMDEPPRRLASALKAASIDPARFVAYQHGETRMLDSLFE
jgi:N-acyl-phosphatidylethanolamine-hydrolysing phospholipase D